MCKFKAWMFLCDRQLNWRTVVARPNKLKPDIATRQTVLLFKIIPFCYIHVILFRTMHGILQNLHIFRLSLQSSFHCLIVLATVSFMLPVSWWCCCPAGFCTDLLLSNCSQHSTVTLFMFARLYVCMVSILYSAVSLLTVFINITELCDFVEVARDYKRSKVSAVIETPKLCWL